MPSPPLERYLAPVLVLGLHAVLVFDVAVHRRELLTLEPLRLLEWALVATAVGVYLCTVTADPGFLRPPSAKPASGAAAGGVGAAGLLLAVVLAPAAWIARATGWNGRSQSNSGSSGLGDGVKANVVGAADARELQPIGRIVLDSVMEGDSDPGEETISFADLEGGGRPADAARTIRGGGADVSSPPADASIGGGLAVTGRTEDDADTRAVVLSVEGGDEAGANGARNGYGVIGRKRRSDQGGDRPGTPRRGDREDRRAVLQSGHRLRWCRFCQMHQPLRTKHCRDCGRCVRTHDHHCPWIGTCVGEGNRVYFYWFLAAQTVELAVFLVEGILSLIEESGPNVGWWIKRTPLLCIGLVVIALMLVMVTCLFSFHSYLAFVNMTTWENVSWHNISYLRGLPPEEGSPFSRGLHGNMAAYCRIPPRRRCPSAPCLPRQGGSCCPRGCCGLAVSPAASAKRTEDGWAAWELGDPTRPMELNCGCARCDICGCFEAG